MAPKKLIPAVKKYEASIHRFYSIANNTGILTLDDLTNSALSESMTVTQSGVVTSNMTIYGSLNSENLGVFRNRIMNGDMRVDQRGSVNGPALTVSLTGTGAGGSAEEASTVYSVDRWAISNGAASGTLCAAQVALTDVDKAAIGGQFTNAMAIGVSPVVGLSAYMPFNSNVLDVSGNGVVLTPTGSMAYRPGHVGNAAVYLANEANVLVTSTAAANYLLNTTYSFAQSFTVSLWFLCTKIPPGTASVIFSTNSGGNTLIIYVDSTPLIFFGITGMGNYTGAAITVDTWAHVVIVNNNGALSFYVNGVQTSTTTTAFGNIGFKLGDRPGTINPFAGCIDEFRIYNRALSATEIAALANVAPVTVAPTTNLTSRITLDNTALDSLGALSAPVATGTTTYSKNSKSGIASLDITANTAGATPATNCLTYTLASGSYTMPLSGSLWFNCTSPTSAVNQVIFAIGNNTSTLTYAVQMFLDNAGTGKIYLYVTIAGVAYSTPPFSVIADTWYHFAFTATNYYLNLYLNGVMIASAKTAPGALNIRGGAGASGTPTQLRIGAGTGTSLQSAFKGYVDDLRIYNRDLSATEIAGLYYSYQNAAYTLYQQPIEGLNVADLAWGTSAAQPATVSAWIKNNTSNAQQFSFSAGNAGAAAALAAVTFEGGSSNDTLGFLTNPIGTNVVYSASIYKVGERSLDLTANTVGGTPSTSISYNYNYASLPLSVSMWIYPTAATNYATPFNIGSLVSESFTIYITSSSQIFARAYVSGVNYSSSSITITLSQWLHVAVTLQTGMSMILYLNGVAVSSITMPSTALALTVTTTTSLPSMLKIGCRGHDNTYAFKGYIDDFRIYEKALTAAEIYQIYSKNVSGTTVSQYLLPRSYIYTTPSIPSGAWQKISFVIPGDTTDAAWAKDITCGVNLALCLGASAPYVGSDVVGGWSSAQYYTGSNIQAYGASANNFLADTSNSIYLTGVQFEKGTMASPFELRPYSEELQLCQRYYETISVVNQGGTQVGSQWASSIYKVVKRVIPTFSYTALGAGSAFESAVTFNDSFRFTRTAADPGVYGLRIDAEL